jgi:hypothetical protein
MQRPYCVGWYFVFTPSYTRGYAQATPTELRGSRHSSLITKWYTIHGKRCTKKLLIWVLITVLCFFISSLAHCLLAHCLLFIVYWQIVYCIIYWHIVYFPLMCKFLIHYCKTTVKNYYFCKKKIINNASRRFCKYCR